MKPTRTVTRVPLAQLTQDPENARLHSAENRGMIERSLKHCGPARPIVTDEAGVILAGNATQTAALKAGIAEARVIDVDGETLVAVRVSGLSDVQKMELAMFDNRSADLGAWDADRLRAIERANGAGLAELFFPHELDVLLGRKVPNGATLGNLEEGDGANVTLASRFGPHPTCLHWRQYRFYLTPEFAERLSTALDTWVKTRGPILDLAAPLVAKLKETHASA